MFFLFCFTSFLPGSFLLLTASHGGHHLHLISVLSLQKPDLQHFSQRSPSRGLSLNVMPQSLVSNSTSAICKVISLLQYNTTEKHTSVVLESKEVVKKQILTQLLLLASLRNEQPTLVFKSGLKLEAGSSSPLARGVGLGCLAPGHILERLSYLPYPSTAFQNSKVLPLQHHCFIHDYSPLPHTPYYYYYY